jgi:hypothetical protein
MKKYVMALVILAALLLLSITIAVKVWDSLQDARRQIAEQQDLTQVLYDQIHELEKREAALLVKIDSLRTIKPTIVTKYKTIYQQVIKYRLPETVEVYEKVILKDSVIQTVIDSDSLICFTLDQNRTIIRTWYELQECKELLTLCDSENETLQEMIQVKDTMLRKHLELASYELTQCKKTLENSENRYRAERLKKRLYMAGNLLLGILVIVK